MVQSISSGVQVHEQPVKLPKAITEEDSYRCTSSRVRYRRLHQTSDKLPPDKYALESNNYALECNQCAPSEPQNHAPEPKPYDPAPVEADTGYINAISGCQNSGERFISKEIREQLEREEEMQHFTQQMALGVGNWYIYIGIAVFSLCVHAYYVHS